MTQLVSWQYTLTVLLAAGLLAGCSQQGGEQAGGQAPFEGIHVFEGRVSDSSCGAVHRMEDARACTEACVGAGDSYVLVVGDVVHTLEGNADDIREFAGAIAQVSASLDGDTLRVVQIRAPNAGMPNEG